MSRIQPINGGSPITYNQIQYKKYVHRPWNRAVLQVVGDLNIFYSLGDSGVFITLWPWRPRLLRPKKRLGENTVGVVVVCKEERKHNWDWGWDWDNFRSVFVWTKNRRRCCLWFIFQVSWVWLYNLSFVWKYWNNHTVSILTLKKKNLTRFQVLSMFCCNYGDHPIYPLKYRWKQAPELGVHVGYHELVNVFPPLARNEGCARHYEAKNGDELHCVHVFLTGKFLVCIKKNLAFWGRVIGTSPGRYLPADWNIPTHLVKGHQLETKGASNTVKSVSLPPSTEFMVPTLPNSNAKNLGGGSKDFLCSPRNPAEMIQFDQHIFQIGWNHQLENMWTCHWGRWRKMGINVPIPGKFMPAALMRLELLSVATCQRKGPLKITTFCPSFQGGWIRRGADQSAIFESFRIKKHKGTLFSLRVCSRVMKWL